MELVMPLSPSLLLFINGTSHCPVIRNVDVKIITDAYQYLYSNDSNFDFAHKYLEEHPNNYGIKLDFEKPTNIQYNNYF
jgi:hypothetical protein